MGYQANVEGFEGQNIEVSVNFWSGPKLLVNGEPAQKGNKRGEMLLQRNDGKQVAAIWKPQFLGLDVPKLSVDGKTISFVEPLKWYQWAWGGWPVILVFVGGALGAIAGMIGFLLNAKIFRTGLSNMLKYVATGAISILAVVAYSVVALIFSLPIGG
jgi:hypothetical protein